MFTNLIESSSHANEFKRRGSFFLFTTVTYFLLFAIAGVASIYAYDARLEDQDTETLVMLTPVDLPSPAVEPAHNAVPPRGGTTRNTIPERQSNTVSVNVPQVVPNNISAAPSQVKPLPDQGPWVPSSRDTDPVGSGIPGSNGVPAGTGRATPPIEVGTPPPPMPTPVSKPKPQVISKGVITSQAISLPKPAYPPIAKQVHIQGAVSVQVLIDESGKVISAKTVAGHPLLAAAAQQAAMQARFSPTFLGDQAMKVSGVITYNFMLDR